MTAIDAIKKIKVALGIQKFEAVAKLVDGTEVHVDNEFAPGEQLHVVAEDGSFVPAPEGVHETEDGQLVTVDAAGVIVSIEDKPAEEALEEEKVEIEEEEKVEMAEEEEVTVEVAVAPEMVQAVIDALAPIVEQVKELETEMKKMQASFSKFSNEPAAEPVRNNFSAQKTNELLASRLETISAIRNKK